MNSIESEITPDITAANLKLLRSGNKHIIFSVEGQSDSRLLHATLGIPLSNIQDCKGKEKLDAVFEIKCKEGGKGIIFLRDRDWNQKKSCEKNGILMCVTETYDIEIELLKNRIFTRFIQEHAPEEKLDFLHICKASAPLGALRKYSTENNLNFNFHDIEFKKPFFCSKKIETQTEKLLDYILARAEKPALKNEASEFIEKTLKEHSDENIVCNYDFLEALGKYLRHKKKIPPQSDSKFLSKIVRSMANLDDMQKLSYAPSIIEYVNKYKDQWEWPGDIAFLT